MKDDRTPELPGMRPPPDISETQNREIQNHDLGIKVYAARQLMILGCRRLSKEEARFYELHNRLPNKNELKSE